MAKERDKMEEEAPTGLMLPEDAHELSVEEAAKDGLIPVPGSGDDLETPGPVPARPLPSAPPLPENLRLIAPELAPPTSTAASTGRSRHTPRPTEVDTALPAETRVFAAIGSSPERELENAVTDPMVKKRGWTPLAVGAGLGTVALVIGGAALSVNMLQNDKRREETGIVEPSLSELLRNKRNTSEMVAPGTPPVEVPESEEVKELKQALRASRDGILVVWCGEKPGQLSLTEEVILYPKGDPESAWTAVQWQEPWKQIQGFDAFPKALRDFCDEAHASKKAIITLSKASQ